MGTKSKKQIFISLISVIILVSIDQFTKQLAVIFLKNQNPVPIIKDVFELQYLENTSAAFGSDPISLLHNLFSFEIFNNNPELFLQVRMGFFVVLTIVMLCLFAWFFIRIPSDDKRFKFLDIILIFLASGAIGNFIDRIFQQYVVDFLYFKLINFPIFNVADIYVTCAAIAVLGLGIFYYKDEDFERIFPSKSKNKKEHKA